MAARKANKTRLISVELKSPTGHTLPCRLHVPHEGGPFPGVLMLPGGLAGANALEGPTSVITPQCFARNGFAAMSVTPSGREGALGLENWNGPEHQQEVLSALRVLANHPLVDASNIIIVSISFGLVLALGALSYAPDHAEQVRGVIDWEGPGHRRWFAGLEKNGFLSDPQFWEHREGVELVKALKCPYYRLQSSHDHVHGDNPEIGLEMVRAATHAGVPVVAFNGNFNANEWTTRSSLLSPNLSDQRDAILLWAQSLLVSACN
jgi:hypothetical protein